MPHVSSQRDSKRCINPTKPIAYYPNDKYSTAMNFKYLLLLTVSFLFSQLITAQNTKNWKTYLAYYETTHVVETNERVYALANGALYSYGKNDEKITTYSKQNGLSDTDISLIDYCPDTHTLIIVYSNGNIDLYDSDGFKNMPYLKNATNIQSKNVNDIYFHNHLAYFATDFGIMVVNLQKKEIADTYKINKVVKSVCIIGETIYASTTEGIWNASTKDNLLDASVWQKKLLSNEAYNKDAISSMRYFKDHLIFCVKEDGLYYEASDGTIKQILKQTYIKDIQIESGELLAYTADDKLYIYSDLNNFIYVNTGTINDVTSLKEDGKYWIASGTNGLVGIQKSGDNQFSKFVSDIVINSPKRNYNTFMTINNDRLLITGGDRADERSWRPGTFMICENNEWNNFDEMIVNNETLKLIGEYCRDYMAVAVDPDDPTHYYIATYGEGIIELKDNEFVNLHNSNNSPLASAITGNLNYIRIGSVCFDKNKNLWAINCNTRNAINVLKANGEWSSLYYSPLNNAEKANQILITSRGHKWINIPYDAGIFVLDDNNTIDDTSDDKYEFFSSFKDAANNTIAAGEYLCMAEDKNGTIWIGTNIGPLKCSTPLRAIENPDQLRCTRLTRDGEAYFLSGESVTAIAVDADNQKWLGTASQGVFLINEDGNETIYNFNTSNSPLLSNTINSIAVNDKTGEVFFGTANGLVSYNSGVTSGSKPFSDVYAFPNPVRPDFNDKVTITGLTNNANVKITDINGNLIYQARAVGNQLVWNCRSANGNRVATGIYVVLAATDDASESVVTKIAVVK